MPRAADTFVEAIAPPARAPAQITDANLTERQKSAIVQMLASIGQSDQLVRALHFEIDGLPHVETGGPIGLPIDPMEDRGLYLGLLSARGRALLVTTFVNNSSRLRAVRIFQPANLELPGSVRVRMGMTPAEVDAIYGGPKERERHGADESRPVWRRYAFMPDANLGSANHARVFFTDPISDGTPAVVVNSIQFEETAHRTVVPGESPSAFAPGERR